MTTARRGGALGALQASPYFRGLSELWLDQLAEAAALEEADAGEEVEVDVDGTPRLYLLAVGELSTSTPPDSEGVSSLEDGRPEPLAELDRGNFFGEIALIQGTTRMASAVAVSNTEVLTIRKDAFDVLHRRSASFRRAARLLAEMRLEANVAPQPDPELVWLVNESLYPSEQLAALVTAALR